MTFYFAWIDPGTAFNTVTHAVFDEDVFSVDISQKEGDFALLQVDVVNPRIGLLNPARKQWAWLAEDVAGTPTPLFLGRLVGIPTDLNREIVRLSFVARPVDYEAQKVTAANALKVAPFYDPIWIDSRFLDDPDTVLEGRPAVWHVHRVTHVLSASDIIAGEGSTIALGPDEIRHESLGVTFSQRPANQVTIDGRVTWEQAAIGSVDITQNVKTAFAAAGSGSNLLTSYTGEGLIRNWPSQGTRIGAGWSVGATTVTRVDGVSVPRRVKTFQIADGTTGQFPLWSLQTTFPVDYDVSRSRSETLTVSFGAATQRIYTDALDDDTIIISRASSLVSEPVDTGDAVPIGDVRRRSYFLTDRGRQSVEHLICLGRVHLLRRARAVEISFATKYENIRSITCRDNVILTDPRLPGGQATGKVVGYRLAFSGQRGAWDASVTMACTVGTGASITITTGTGSYVDTGYADAGWQITTGGATGVAGDSIAYDDYGATTIDDDGIELTTLDAATAVVTIGVEGGETAQTAVLNGGPYADIAEAISLLNASHTEFCISLLPLTGGPFETDFALTATDLMVPKTIDLEADEVSA